MRNLAETGRLTAFRPVLLVLLTAGLASGCTKYQLHVEMDRMTGTAFPLPQVQSGKTYTVEGVYTDAWWDLVNVNENDTDIAPLTGPADPWDPDQYDYITEAELDTVESAKREAPVGETSCGNKCRQFHVYGIIVDHYLEEADGTRRQSTIGQMWTSDNRAFVMYHKSHTIQTSQAKYFRSTLHEIGHAHNLHHEDGDGSMTIMNKTGTVGSSFNYEFSNASRKHLKRHPKGCKLPGISTWKDINWRHQKHDFMAVVSCG